MDSGCFISRWNFGIPKFEIYFNNVDDPHRGNAPRHSFDKAAEQSSINIVTAFAHGARLTLGITQSAKGGGEILALRELIQMLDIRGISITADGLHCQRETCELIVQQDGDYCFQLKGN